HVLRDLLLQAGGNLPLSPHVRDAGRGRDREAGRDGNSDRRHLGEADPFAAEQLAAEVRSFREVEYVAVVHSGQDYRGFFGRLDGPTRDSDTDAMRCTSLMLALLALLVVLSMAGGGFLDGPHWPCLPWRTPVCATTTFSRPRARDPPRRFPHSVMASTPVVHHCPRTGSIRRGAPQSTSRPEKRLLGHTGPHVFLIASR